MAPFDVFVDGLVQDMLKFPPQQDPLSLRLRVVYQPVIEVLTDPLLLLDTGLWGKIAHVIRASLQAR